MSNITKEFVSQNVQEFNRIQELNLSEQEQEKVVEGVLEDQEVWETFLEFVSKHTSEVVGKRVSDSSE